MDYITSKDLNDSNRFRQEVPEIDDKPQSPTAMEPFSTESIESVLEPCINPNADLPEHNVNVPATATFSEKALPAEESISKIYSSKMCAESKCVSEENSVISSINCSNANTFPGVIGSVKTVPILLDSSESKDMMIPQSSISSTKLDQVALENIKKSDGSPSTPCKPIFDLPSVTLQSKNDYDFQKTMYQAMKPPIRTDMNCDNTLGEILSILDNWARKGLDRAFDISMKTNFADIGSRFEKDFQYGLSVMKHMTSRIYVLIRTANKLPDPDIILASEFPRGRNRVRGDLIGAGIAIWHSVDNIELLLIKGLKKVKVICENVSGFSTEDVSDMEEIANPNSVIAHLYTSVIINLLMLRTEIEEFHDKIRAFCSDLERLL
ncbi:uncharacterized protein LOC129957271 [Argiope bruennichi]|uniref:uncharacterized protein LOC129957271 n=1 Tax=Argiope bruennichi TaxID=94029 RepID=UPI0024957207|nr:uncharacterized protein LOC129957271 [Argiope bruennichi]XP_055925502.1 uncharacterized protein LOC129957271 [Argiope bruennichi]